MSAISSERLRELLGVIDLGSPNVGASTAWQDACDDLADVAVDLAHEVLSLRAACGVPHVVRLSEMAEFDPNTLRDVKTGQPTVVYTLNQDGLTVDMEEE